MSETLIIKELKITHDTLEFEFSHEIADAPFEPNYFNVDVFAPGQQRSTEIRLVSIKQKKERSLVFKIEHELEFGAVVVARISPCLTKEQREDILKAVKAKQLDVAAISVSVTESSIILDSVQEIVAGVSSDEFCDVPQLVWKSAKSTAKDISVKQKEETVLTLLETAEECEDDRCASLERVSEYVHQNREKGANAKEWDKLANSITWLQQLYCKQDAARTQVLYIMSTIALAITRFTHFDQKIRSSHCSFIALGMQPNLPQMLGKLSLTLNHQSLAADQLLMSLETCVETKRISTTMQGLLKLQTEVEGLCCSLLCEFQRVQYAYATSLSEELHILIAAGAHYVSRTRRLLSNLTIDPLNAWKQFSGQLTTMQTLAEKMGKQITNPNLKATPKAIQQASTSIGIIQTNVTAMNAQSQSLQQVSASSGTLVSQYRSWSVQIEQQVDILLALTELDKCGFRAELLQISTLTIQIYCYLTYVEHEYVTYEEELQKAAAKQPSPALPTVSIVKSLSNTAGVAFAFPEQVSRRFTSHSAGYLKIIDATSGKLLQIYHAEPAISSLNLTAPLNTVLEIEAYADGELIGTAIGTAVAYPADTSSASPSAEPAKTHAPVIEKTVTPTIEKVGAPVMETATPPVVPPGKAKAATAHA